jgi:hypothetical protein
MEGGVQMLNLKTFNKEQVVAYYNSHPAIFGEGPGKNTKKSVMMGDFPLENRNACSREDCSCINLLAEEI